jgi:hypothetical protein
MNKRKAYEQSLLQEIVATKMREIREEGIPVDVSCHRTTRLPAHPKIGVAVESTGSGGDSRV